jgi:NitT/TauT family transport system permease protein
MPRLMSPLLSWAPAFRPNRWDFLMLPFVVGFLFFLAWATKAMTIPYTPGEPLPVSLDPGVLPEYAWRTVLRMVAALLLSLLFALTYGTLAAKNRFAERILVPLLDILQSVPILGFLSITVTGFIALFPGRLLGLEFAAIFAIFTSQAWNMAFSVYQSLRLVPGELQETARLYRLSAWQRFWKLELPFALPSLIWNTMMSVSGGWFFVVASEAITVAGHTALLPGIGSYIALAIGQENLTAIGWAIFTMLVVILLYDQLLFRPLIAWADKFKFGQSEEEERPSSWVLRLLQQTRLMRALVAIPAALWELSLRAPRAPVTLRLPIPTFVQDRLERFWTAGLALAAILTVYAVVHLIRTEVGWGEVLHVLGLGVITGTRVLVLVVLASLVWIPIGVWIGLHPRLAEHVRPIAQFLAAFPANLLFPLAVVLIAHYHLNVDIWTSPLMILGTQWYILFNVIAGASAIPAELHEVARAFDLRGWQWWRRLALPAIFPAFITGAITASGGAWNASIVAEVVSWGDHRLVATGLGAYITQWTVRGDAPHIALGISVMVLFVLAFNWLLWRRLYAFAERHMRLG